MISNMTDQKIELVDDTQVLNEDFKKNVAIPYFKDIYKDLVQQSDNKSKGINKLSILTVSTILLTGKHIKIFEACTLFYAVDSQTLDVLILHTYSIRNCQELLEKDFSPSLI